MNWGDASVGHIRPFVIVAPQPIRGGLLSVIDRFEQMLVQPLVTHGAIEALDIRILSRLLGLDKHQPDAALLGPGLELGTAHFTAIV